MTLFKISSTGRKPAQLSSSARESGTSLHDCGTMACIRDGLAVPTHPIPRLGSGGAFAVFLSIIDLLHFTFYTSLPATAEHCDWILPIIFIPRPISFNKSCLSASLVSSHTNTNTLLLITA